jgi:thymidine kinase
MFLENNLSSTNRGGWIEIITGSMFSGKTEELIRRMRRAEIAKQKIGIFKPKIDKRYSKDHVVSHDAKSIPSIPVNDAKTILEHTQDLEVIGIDEAQFFEKDIVEVCDFLANNGKRVIVAALDMDFTGKPFGPVPMLISIAEYVTKVHAICMRCGSLAHYSHRLSNAQKLVVLGEKDIYEPLCRQCFIKARNIQKKELELFR